MLLSGFNVHELLGITEAGTAQFASDRSDVLWKTFTWPSSCAHRGNNL